MAITASPRYTSTEIRRRTAVSGLTMTRAEAAVAIYTARLARPSRDLQHFDASGQRAAHLLQPILHTPPDEDRLMPLPKKLLLLCSLLAPLCAIAQVTVKISPRQAPLTLKEAQQFTATVSNTTNKSVTWLVDGVA